jgi:hypothetical protein
MKCVQKEFDRADIVRDVRLPLSAQLVDATLSSSLIQQHFPEKIDLSGGTQSEPSQGSVPFDSHL